MNTQVEEETYNPWSVVNLVFRHLASEGLHPVLGDQGDPGAPAAEGNLKISQDIRDHLAEIRTAMFGDS